MHPGVNCFTGFGATTLDKFGIVQIGVAECKALCLELSRCEGFVVDTNREANGRITCYRDPCGRCPIKPYAPWHKKQSFKKSDASAAGDS